MEANLKTYLPQEGTGSNDAGESLLEPSSGCPLYSGGGKISLTSNDTNTSRTDANLGEKTKPRLLQQTFHSSMFYSRPRSNSLCEIPNLSASRLNQRTPDRTLFTELNHGPRNPEWQRVPVMRYNKRRRTDNSPPTIAHTSTSNSFDGLPIDTMDMPIDTPDLSEPAKKVYKPPPLILYGIEDINKLSETIETLLNPGDYNFKIITKNQLRVNCSNTESYKKLMSLVREKGLIGHTFTHKADRCCRIVIRNLHHTTPLEEIIKEISITGNTIVGEIINARYGPEKKPTSTFFVNLEPSANNKKVKDIKYIFRTAVIIEDPRKRKTIVQCTRCQQYGHTKNNCTRPFRCVKCALQHKTSDCQKKDRNTPAKCALCFGSHPANFKGCEVYKEILQRKFDKGNKPHTKNHVLTNNPMKGKLTQENYDKKEQSHQLPTDNPTSYANTAKCNLTHNDQRHSVEELLLKQSEKIDTLLQQISSLMGLIVTLVDKISK